MSVPRKNRFTTDIHANWRSSAKINMLIETVKALDGQKCVVFSQWTAMMDLIGIALDKADAKYSRIDGSMSLQNRIAAVQAFNSDPSTTVMMLSLKAGGVGLNLTVSPALLFNTRAPFILTCRAGGINLHHVRRCFEGIMFCCISRPHQLRSMVESRSRGAGTRPRPCF